jgi:hypothetical protein
VTIMEMPEGDWLDEDGMRVPGPVVHRLPQYTMMDCEADGPVQLVESVRKAHHGELRHLCPTERARRIADQGQRVYRLTPKAIAYLDSRKRR